MMSIELFYASLRRWNLMLVCMIFTIANPAAVNGQSSVDRIRLERGSEVGEVLKMTPLAVTISKGSTGNKDIPVNEIRSIIFKDEPNELTRARVVANNGGFQNALEMLERIDLGDVRRDLIQQEIEFYRALSMAKLALAGSGEIVEAGRQIRDFLRSHRNNYHYFDAVEVLGDLYVAAGSHANAEGQYGILARAPWSEYQARAAILMGRALQAQDKHAEAAQQFDEALRLAGDDEDGKSQRLSATLEKAISLAQTGELEQGLEMISGVIRDADPEADELHARAYNALGDCYRKANKPKDAILAYLHVDILHSSARASHAEALARLAALWESIGHVERAREARQLLQEEYPASRWANGDR